MRAVASPRQLVAAFVVGVAALGVSSFGASARCAATAAKAPKTVNATLITRAQGTLAPGSKVRSSAVAGQRVFTDARTNDGGKHWRRALFTTGLPVAVVRDIQGHLTAFVGSLRGGSASRYVSKDGGRIWRLA